MYAVQRSVASSAAAMAVGCGCTRFCFTYNLQDEISILHDAFCAAFVRGREVRVLHGVETCLDI